MPDSCSEIYCKVQQNGEEERHPQAQLLCQTWSWIIFTCCIADNLPTEETVWHSFKLCKYEKETSSRRNNLFSQPLNTVQFLEYEINYCVYKSVPLEPHPNQTNAIKISLKSFMTRGHELGR